MKFDVIVSDPPWSFSDSLTMSKVPRGAKTNYKVLDMQAIRDLKVSEIASDNAVLALWVPSSFLQDGLDTMKAWGFRQTQTHIWVKVKLDPLEEIKKNIRKLLKNPLKHMTDNLSLSTSKVFDDFDLDNLLITLMGRIFRQTHEVCLLGVKGKAYSMLKNKSQRSVHFSPNPKHSEKPEILQDRLELMFPNTTKLEMFARRSRTNWTCVGLECPDTPEEDIRDSIEKLSKAP